MLNSIVLIIPLLLLIVGIEWYISYKKDHHNYTSGNFAMNVAIGAMDQLASLVYFTALYFALDFVYTHFRLFTLDVHWYHWVTAYVVIDFLSYWYHRFSHRVNILWAGHVTHHSSEHFNFSNGFRTSFFQGVNRILFWSVLPLFGFTPVMLVIILKVSGLYDFLLHTKYIPKLGVLEEILVTPSQHRVHHGRNDSYIDKNYGSTFVIWDKLFGTFQEETEEVEYGIKGPYVDNNPFMAVGYYYYYLWHAMKTKANVVEKIRLLFLPPDRTPQPDFARLKAIRKSSPGVPYALRQYAWFQVACTVPGMIMLLLYKDILPLWQFVVYACAATGCIGMGAMILNGNIRAQFAAIESLRLGFTLLLAFAVFAVTLKLYAGVIALFLLFSYVLLMQIAIKTTADVSKHT
jgi:alkylglycerol monooxygenase